VKINQETSHVTVTHHSSHVTRHTSHVTRHTSHVTRHSSHVIQQNSAKRAERCSPAGPE
jgi:hypothetical protein